MFFENKEHYNPKLMALTLSFFMVTFIIGRNGVKFFFVAVTHTICHELELGSGFISSQNRKMR